MLKTVAAASFSAVLPGFATAQSRPGWLNSITAYLQSLARSDGGYGWADQDHSHLTATFAVIGCYRALKLTPPDPAALAEYVRTHHPSRIKKLEQERRAFEFQQVQALRWLGGDASEFRDRIRAWTRPLAYLKQYEKHGYPVFQSELGAFFCRPLLDLPLDDLSPHFIEYLESRRRTNGSFNNTPALDGSDGHIMNTWWGLQALHIIGRAEENKAALIEWLRSCQLPNGGFTYQPKPAFAGVDGVDYTWAAVRALELLGSEPANRSGCIAYLQSLANIDGGFGDRSGWPSNPMGTCRAIDALAVLSSLEGPGPERRNSPRGRPSPSAELKVFTIQLESHGRGSPAEAVDLARALRIHLWGAKNAQPGWIARAQSLADEQRVPVRFFVSDEEYGTWVDTPGLGTYSHTSDIIAPAGRDFGQSLAQDGVITWPEFRDRRLAPLVKAGGRLIWQFGENEELVRLFLDDSIEGDGYAGISTYHFGNPDFTNTEPFLHRWRGHIPFVALQDAHGSEPWWFADMTTGFRTLFLATEPTWDAWLNALEKNWVAAVRRDSLSNGKTWMHSGSRAVLDFIRERELEWRWWENPDIHRPLASIVAVKSDDQFEMARPEKGLTLRIRCAWENTAQGMPKSPLVELRRFIVDGIEQKPEPISKRRPRGSGLADHYYTLHLANPAPGKHTAVAHIRVLKTNQELSHTLEFSA